MSYDRLSILIIGLGSMGKRRIRNLRANGVRSVTGVDLRSDRCEEAARLYGIPVFSNFEEAKNNTHYDAWIISVPPHLHHIYMKRALQHNTPCFIEASVVDTDMELLVAEARQKKILLAPSYTLYFHPAVRHVADIVQRGSLGKISNILYHSGQYLPDWHSYESVSDYYVSRRETGGAREIVPFELTWLTLLFGLPKRIVSFYKKTVQIEGAADIDDTYNILLDYKDFMVNLCVDVVSRYATRRLVINGDKRQLTWSWDENFIALFDPASRKWEHISFEADSAEAGYNKNITETMYNREIGAFLDAINGTGTFLNTIEKDHRVLQLLYAAEKSADTNCIQAVL